ncbi:hypothetical protein PVT68_12305 [Microbulbifer bruguierae]|uniref:Bacterial repeat domain-containing protein n=1 Tax=Microbulbifer bruguierae TaxID=3029061 RepID=A0ABY8NAD9_9GAMM|nr:choice-of-anchor tandem repeat GloVer-containing protein [Microbulbifer bruguierae]WGL15552.1 hypothetical protein PVT68_12305 [Microbulbifer bruguierae]
MKNIGYMILVSLLLVGCGGGSSGSSDNNGGDGDGGGSTRYQVSVSASPAAAGTVTGGGNYDAGSSVTVSAAANAGYSFVDWMEFGEGVASSAEYTFTLSAERSLTANFVANEYRIGGTVSGLVGALVLRNNGGDDLIVEADGSFSFSAPVVHGEGYSVTVAEQPDGQACTVAQGSGAVSAADVTGISVTCIGTVAKSCADYNMDGRAPVVQNDLYMDLASFTRDPSAPYTSGANGEDPRGVLVEGPDGNFYGVTYRGGVPADNGAEYQGYTGEGVVFRLAPDGTLARLHTFNYISGDALYGTKPMGGLVLGSDCQLYGTTYQSGGVSGTNGGTVFRISLEGELTYLAGFQGGNGMSPRERLTLGSDGNFYGTTLAGGAQYGILAQRYQGTVYKLTPDGTLTTLFSFDKENGGTPTGPLVEGDDGYLYGMTRYGGTFDGGTVFKISKAGDFSLLHSFNKELTTLDQEFGLAKGADGNFYGFIQYGGAFNAGGVFRITSQGEYSLLSSFNPVTPELGCNCGIASPNGSLVLAADGFLYGVANIGAAAAGNGSKGAVIRVTHEGDVSPLVYFQDYGNAWTEGLTQGSDGHLYGMSREGGTEDNGLIYRVLLP